MNLRKIAIISGEIEVTFSQMLKKISLFAKYTPKEKGSKTLVMSENREGWIYALYSVWCNRGVMIPVDAMSTQHDVEYIINDSKPQAVWVSSSKKELVQRAVEATGCAVDILLIDDYEQQDVSNEAEAKVAILDGTLQEDGLLGDTCLICYTSGTTGSPKGVMLSYENVMANVRAVSTEVNIFDDEQRTIVLLPLHHVLPLVGTAVIPMVVGGGVAICPSLAAADIMGTLQRGKIGIMIGVPRLWQTLFNGIKGKVFANGVTRTLYNICDSLQNRTLSRLVFSSVRKKMGGAIKYCVSGGAALDSVTARGLKTLGLDVLEGYGMTEAAPMICFTRPDDIRPGCVGLPVPSVEVKLDNGELCARGKNVMQGYYNRPEETADIIDTEGWLHTGDLATIDDAGRVTITGRKKEIIVLSNGKNVNPAEIEEKLEVYNEIVKEAAVTQDGDLLKAIIVPQPAWKASMQGADMEEAIKREVLQPYNDTVAPYKKLMSVMVYEGDLPRTRLDKLQRFKLKELLEGNAPQTEDAVVESEVLDEVDTLVIDYITAEKNIKAKLSDNLETDLAMDSLDKVSLQGFIEQTFGMKITTDQISSYKCIAELTAFVREAMTRMEVEDIDWQKLLTQPTDAIRLPRMASTGRMFAGLFRCFSRVMFSPEVKGVENIPADGPFIIAPNHQSYLDGPLVISTLPNKVLYNTFFYAKKDHVRGTIARMMARNHNIIVMDMSTLKDSIQQLGKVLQDGKNIVIFPEGTRTRTGKLGQYKKTFAILAKELGVPVLPVRIDGAYEAWPRHKSLPRCHKVSITYMPILKVAEGESYENFANRVKESVLALK